MNCSNCKFATNGMTFGRTTDYYVKCTVTNEYIFRIEDDEAKMMGIELLADYQDPLRHYPILNAECDSLERIMPGPFQSYRDDWMEDRTAFFKHVILEPQECICTAGDVEAFIAERLDWAEDLREKMAEINRELARHLQDLDSAWVLVEVLYPTPDELALKAMVEGPAIHVGLTEAVNEYERTH